MKVKIEAGATMDVLTAKEMRQELDQALTAWRGEVARGIRWRRISTFGTPSGGSVTIGDGAEDRIGPANGMLWQVKRVSVTGYVPPAWGGVDRLAVYTSSVTPSSTLVGALESPYQQLYDEVLGGGQTLIVSGTVATTARVWLTVSVKEAPESLMWRL